MTGERIDAEHDLFFLSAPLVTTLSRFPLFALFPTLEASLSLYDIHGCPSFAVATFGSPKYPAFNFMQSDFPSYVTLNLDGCLLDSQLNPSFDIGQWWTSDNPGSPNVCFAESPQGRASPTSKIVKWCARVLRLRKPAASQRSDAVAFPGHLEALDEEPPRLIGLGEPSKKAASIKQCRCGTM